MTNRDLTPDEVNSLLDQRGQLNPETIPAVSEAPPSGASLWTSSLLAVSKTRRPAISGHPESSGEEHASTSPASFVVQQRPPLEQLKTAIARATNIWSEALAQPLRTTVRLDVEDAQACHAGLGSQYELPGCIQILQANPLGESIYLQIDRGIVFGMIDRLLGGGKSPLPNVRRAITEIETSLMLRITAGLMKALEGLFPASATQSLSTLRVESNPQCIPLQQPAYYQLRILRVVGKLHGCHAAGVTRGRVADAGGGRGP